MNILGIINIIQNLYEGQMIHVKLDKFLSAGIYLQGGSELPTYDKIFIEQRALKTWKRKCQGMAIDTNDRTIYTLQIADDQVEMAQDRDDLRVCGKKIARRILKVGYDTSLSKTK